MCCYLDRHKYVLRKMVVIIRIDNEFIIHKRSSISRLIGYLMLDYYYATNYIYIYIYI